MPSSVKVPVPAFVSEPVPEMTPLKVVELLLPPVVSVPVPCSTSVPAPLSEPIVSPFVNQRAPVLIETATESAMALAMDVTSPPSIARLPVKVLAAFSSSRPSPVFLTPPEPWIAVLTRVVELPVPSELKVSVDVPSAICGPLKTASMRSATVIVAFAASVIAPLRVTDSLPEDPAGAMRTAPTPPLPVPLMVKASPTFSEAPETSSVAPLSTVVPAAVLPSALLLVTTSVPPLTVVVPV